MSDTKTINQTRLCLVKGDITDLEVEAFVFYARNDLELGAGYGNAIAMRGGLSVKNELKGLGPVETGKSVVTKAGEMKAQKIVHAVGPKFQEPDTEAKLKATMRSALVAAEACGIKQLAFPAMGAGFYAIPLDLCSRVMLTSLREYLTENAGIEEVLICVLSNRDYKPFAETLDKLNLEGL